MRLHRAIKSLYPILCSMLVMTALVHSRINVLRWWQTRNLLMKLYLWTSLIFQYGSDIVLITTTAIITIIIIIILLVTKIARQRTQWMCFIPFLKIQKIFLRNLVGIFHHHLHLRAQQQHTHTHTHTNTVNSTRTHTPHSKRSSRHQRGTSKKRKRTRSRDSDSNAKYKHKKQKHKTAFSYANAMLPPTRAVSPHTHAHTHADTHIQNRGSVHTHIQRVKRAPQHVSHVFMLSSQK